MNPLQSIGAGLMGLGCLIMAFSAIFTIGFLIYLYVISQGVP